MLGQYYKVGDKTFINPYQALRESAQTGLFSEYILPEENKKSFLNIDPTDLPENKTLIRQKTEYLLDKFPNCVLHYTGGIDSHSILTSGPRFEKLYMYLRGLTTNSVVDSEYLFGLDYAAKHDYDLNVRKITIKDHETWFDAETAFKYADFYPGFNPCWFDFLEPDFDSTAMHIHGWDKPFLYMKDNQYYWIIVDHQEYLRTVKHCDFFQDHFFPQLAVGQVYAMAEYFKNYHPGKQGFLVYKDAHHNKLNQLLGRITTEQNLQPLKTATLFKKFGHFNYKHVESMNEFIDQGRLDIVQAMMYNLKNLIQQIKNAPHAVQQFSVVIDNIGNIDTFKRINRIGAIFKLTADGLELLPHTDISLI